MPYLWMLLGLVLFTASVYADSVHLSWTNPATNADGTPLTDLSHLLLAYGPASGNYTTEVNVGVATSAILSGFPPDSTWFFAVRAVDTSGNRSLYSAPEVSHTFPPADETPSVSDSSIPEGATDVDAMATLTVTFSAPMNPSTLNATTVQLRDDQGTLVPATVTYDATSHTVSLNPSVPLQPATLYTLTITGAEDLDGRVLPTFTLHFTTAPPAASPLVAAYGMNAGTGTLVADSSGLNNHGTRTGATWITSGKYGKALRFDGVNDWVTVPHAPSLDLTTGATLMAWIYPTAHGAGKWRNVLIKQRPGGEVYNLYANSDTNRPKGYVVLNDQPNTPQEVAGPSQLLLNTWQHLAMTYDGVQLQLWVNGASVGSRPLSGTLLTSTGVVRLGGNSVWPEFYQGRIDEVRLYRTALPQPEIQQIMTVPLP